MQINVTDGLIYGIVCPDSYTSHADTLNGGHCGSGSHQFTRNIDVEP